MNLSKKEREELEKKSGIRISYKDVKLVLSYDYP